MEAERLITRVSRPSRYVGGEAGSVVKDPSRVRLNFALAFPEVYEIAMSHMGIKILYESLAPRPDVSAERVFMPWKDLMDLMEAEGLAPWSLETGRSLGAFDAIGFSLQYELTYTNMLHMLRLSGIPLAREKRGPEHPVILAGGPCMVNPEPLAHFLDLAVVGEAEELIYPLMDLLIRAKEEKWPRDELYRRACVMQGVYAPALYRPVWQGGRLTGIEAAQPAPERVRRRIVADLDSQDPPVNPPVAVVKPVHDRFAVEIARGCTRGCRFCQAGFIYRPVRERSAEKVRKASLWGMANTGLEELGLLSLSSGDYTCIEGLAGVLMDALEPRRWSLSLPSLRVDSLSAELAAQLKRVRKSGFTVAPEAGSQRLRQVINKDLTEEQILEMARRVFGLGWNLIKLYFMLGLPGETDDDLDAIGRLCGRVAREARAAGRGGRKPLVNASLGLFVPKPHTPFQWEAQLGLERAEAGLHRVKAGMADSKVRVKWNSPRQSMLEGVLSRGDRRVAGVLENAVEAGCRFDGWSEELDFQAWLDALEKEGLGLQDYLRPRDMDEYLPWDHIDVGAGKEFLKVERQKALAAEKTPDCRHGLCQGCGVCDFELVKPMLKDEPASAPEPAPEAQTEPLTHVFRLEKTGPARFMGHLEMINQVVRAFQRAGVRLAFSQGYHPHPQVKTNSALPLGVESLVERLVVKVVEKNTSEVLARKVNKALPAGLKLADGFEAKGRQSLREPEEVTYLVRTGKKLDPRCIERFNGAGRAVFTRVTPKGSRELDLKNTLKRLSLEQGGLKVVVGLEGGRPKPAEILMGVFGFTPEEAAGARALKIGSAQGSNNA